MYFGKSMGNVNKKIYRFSICFLKSPYMCVKNEVYPERWFLRRSDVRSVVQVQLEVLVNDKRLCLGATAGCSHHVPRWSVGSGASPSSSPSYLLVYSLGAAVRGRGARFVPHTWEFQSSRLLVAVWPSPGCDRHLGNKPANRRSFTFYFLNKN